MTQSNNTAIQKFGDEVLTDLKKLTENYTCDRVGILIAIGILSAHLCRVQTEALHESMASAIREAEQIINGKE